MLTLPQLPPFLTNLILFSPLLLFAAAILYVLDRGDALRRGAGLKPPIPDPPSETTELEREALPEDVDDNDDLESGDEYSDDLDELLQPPENDPGAAGAAPDTPEAGPADPPRPAQQQQPRPPRTRTVGTKKARSIARRDQRRAYHEFLHSQRAQRESAEASLREAEAEAAFENARRRALLDEEIAVKKAEERALKLERERLEKERERKDVQKLKDLIKEKKAWELDGLVDRIGRGRAWVESVLRREGLVGVREGGEVGMITGSGWWVMVRPEDLKMLWGKLEEGGGMEWKEMAVSLEAILGID